MSRPPQDALLWKLHCPWVVSLPLSWSPSGYSGLFRVHCWPLLLLVASCSPIVASGRAISDPYVSQTQFYGRCRRSRVPSVWVRAAACGQRAFSRRAGAVGSVPVYTGPCFSLCLSCRVTGRCAFLLPSQTPCSKRGPLVGNVRPSGTWCVSAAGGLHLVKPRSRCRSSAPRGGHSSPGALTQSCRAPLGTSGRQLTALPRTERTPRM